MIGIVSNNAIDIVDGDFSKISSPQFIPPDLP